MAKEAIKAKEIEAIQTEMANLEAKRAKLAETLGVSVEQIMYEEIEPTGQMKTGIIPLKIYEYVSPFDYSNVEITGPPYHADFGTELDSATGAITITEDEPIIRVSVIGSADTPPGYITLEIPNMGKKLQSVENLMGVHDLPNAAWCREDTAFFEVSPGTKQITLRGGSRNPANNHYAFRVIRVTVEAD
jgi:hypothetical protein